MKRGYGTPVAPHFYDYLAQRLQIAHTTLADQGPLTAAHLSSDLRGWFHTQADNLPEDVTYAWAAFADEMFLHTPWAGQTAWPDHLLEKEMFGTQRAGDAIFERIHACLNSTDVGQGTLFAVYLEILGAGFLGMYRYQRHVTLLQSLKNQLGQRLNPLNEGASVYVPLTDLNTASPLLCDDRPPAWSLWKTIRVALGCYVGISSIMCGARWATNPSVEVVL